MRNIVVGAVLALLASGCVEPQDAPEALGEVEQGIVGGALDTTNQAVVAWIHGSKCSATIIARVGGFGYALTAAHCINGTLGELRQGNNHNAPDRTYPVDNAVAHPEYAVSDAYDFAMLRFTGADAATPVMTVASAAQDIYWNAGQTLQSTGYGVTPSANAQRKSVTLTLDFATDLLLGFDQTSEGICGGDSGGPSNAGNLVFGVHSFTTDTNCTGSGVQGVSMRASAVLDTFINRFITGTPFLDQTCDQCSDAHRQLGSCSDEVSACSNSTACQTYIDCLNACPTFSCQVQCDLTHVQGKAELDAIDDCVCNSACSTECAGDSQCDVEPACYISSGNATCQTCWEASCCTEITNCAANDKCTECFTSSMVVPNCDTNPQLAAVETCLANNCAVECPDGGGGFGGSTSGSGGGGTGGAGGATVGAGGAGPATTGSGAGNQSDEDDEGQLVESGCACEVVGTRRDAPWPLLALLLGLGWRRNRRS